MPSKRITNFFKSIQPTITLDPTGNIMLSFEIQKTSNDITSTIKNLDRTKDDLLEAINLIDHLKSDLSEKQKKINDSEKILRKIQEDKETTETLLHLDLDSFTRILTDSTKRQRRNSLIIGILIGLMTGFLSSLSVWFMTK